MSGDPDFLACEFVVFDEFWKLMDLYHRRLSLPHEFRPELEFYCDMIGGTVIPTDVPASNLPGAQVFSRRALNVLWPMLEKVGRVHDIQPAISKGYTRKMDYKLFVMFEQLDVLDEELTVHVDDPLESRLAISRYSFNPSAIAGLDAFTVKGARSNIFVTDRFLDVVETHRLSGVRLRPVWSDTEGPLRTFKRLGIPFDRIPPGCGPNVVSKRRAMREWLARTRERQPGWRGAE